MLSCFPTPPLSPAASHHSLSLLHKHTMTASPLICTIPATQISLCSLFTHHGTTTTIPPMNFSHHLKPLLNPSSPCLNSQQSIHQSSSSHQIAMKQLANSQVKSQSPHHSYSAFITDPPPQTRSHLSSAILTTTDQAVIRTQSHRTRTTTSLELSREFFSDHEPD